MCGVIIFNMMFFSGAQQASWNGFMIYIGQSDETKLGGKVL